MRQLNGCSTPASRSSAAKQWFQQLAQKTKKITDGNEICNFVNDYFSTIGSRMASSISVPTDADIYYKSLIRFNSEIYF